MLDWLFGSSKTQKKQQLPEQKLNKEDEWVYDFIKQYLLSPIWKNPLLDFIEENCSTFEDLEQNKFEYTKIFQQFISICTILIESIVEQTGITQQTLQQCILKGLKSKNDRKIFTQVLVCDNFEMFKRIMISKNKELEAQAEKNFRVQNKIQDKVQDQIDQMEKQRLEIEQAIALSLALEQKAKDQEELQFQEAIRLSQLTLKEEETKPEQKKEEKPRKSLLGDLPPLMLNSSVKSYDNPAEYTVEKERLNKEINELKANQKPEEASEERKKRLQEQRELLKKKKQEERELQLKTFVENKQATSIPEHKVSEEELAKRKKLMDRLKQQLKSD